MDTQGYSYLKILDRDERKPQMIEMRKNGSTYQEIANTFHLSKQRVCQIIGGSLKSHFKEISSEDCIYPNLRKWMNDNRITKAGLCRRIYGHGHAVCQGYVADFLRGRKPNTTKGTIDKYLIATGLTYEELFEREETV